MQWFYAGCRAILSNNFLLLSAVASLLWSALDFRRSSGTLPRQFNKLFFVNLFTLPNSRVGFLLNFPLNCAHAHSDFAREMAKKTSRGKIDWKLIRTMRRTNDALHLNQLHSWSLSHRYADSKCHRTRAKLLITMITSKMLVGPEEDMAALGRPVVDKRKKRMVRWIWIYSKCRPWAWCSTSVLRTLFFSSLQCYATHDKLVDIFRNKKTGKLVGNIVILFGFRRHQQNTMLSSCDFPSSVHSARRHS